MIFPVSMRPIGVLTGKFYHANNLYSVAVILENICVFDFFDLIDFFDFFD